MADLVERLNSWGQDPVTPLLHEAAEEIVRLREWKKEAAYIIDMWEQVWIGAGQPGPVGGLKSENVSAEFNRLKALETRLLSAHSTRMPGEWSEGWDAAISWLLTS